MDLSKYLNPDTQEPRESLQERYEKANAWRKEPKRASLAPPHKRVHPKGLASDLSGDQLRSIANSTMPDNTKAALLGDPRRLWINRNEGLRPFEQFSSHSFKDQYGRLYMLLRAIGPDTWMFDYRMAVRRTRVHEASMFTDPDPESRQTKIKQVSHLLQNETLVIRINKQLYNFIVIAVNAHAQRATGQAELRCTDREMPVF